MNENVRRVVDILRHCENSCARCGECPSGKDANGIPNCHSMNDLADLIERLAEGLDTLFAALEASYAVREDERKERDAAIWDITNSAPCFACAHFRQNGGPCKGAKRCMFDMLATDEFGEEYTGLQWKWRGIVAENGGANNGTEADEPQ